MPREKLITVTVLVDDAHKDDLSGLASALKDKGFVLKESLEAVGVLIGTVPAGGIADLSAIPGVSAVEQERTDYRTQEGR
jgi:hypothetical protein